MFFTFKVNTSGPPQEVFKTVEDILKRRLKMDESNSILIPEPSADPRSGDNTKEPAERLPQSIIDTITKIDPILNNHDLLKSDLQNVNSTPTEIKPIVSHGDSPHVDQNRVEQDSDDVEISNQSSEILSEDCASKSSSFNNNSIKEDNVKIAETINQIPDVRDEDLADSLYS